MPPANAPRNVLNTDAVDGFLQGLVAEFRAGQVAGLEKWLTTSARRWILRDYERVWRVEREPMTDQLVLVDPADEGDRVVGPLDGAAPDWVVKAMARGDEIVVIRLNATLRKLLERVVRWAAETTAPGEEPGVIRMAVPDAIEQAERWRRNQQASADQPPGTTLIYSYGELYHFLRLETPETLEIEGDRMANCVGSYAWEVENGECQIVSMRRVSDGASRATIEIDSDGYIQQAKGRANGSVAEEDRLALKTFVNAFGYRVVWDHESFDVPRGANDMGGWDGRVLSRFIRSDEGQAWLRAIRFAGVEDMAATPIGRFIQQVLANRYGLGSRVRRILYRSLQPDHRPIVLRPAYVAPVYDEEISIIRVLAPTPLFQFYEHDVFEDADTRQAEVLEREASTLLPALVFREPDRIFDLGTWREAHHGVHYDGLAGGPANLLEQGDIDIALPRRKRLNALRRRMNDAKYRTIGRTAAPSEPHLAIRRLLDGDSGRYVI